MRCTCKANQRKWMWTPIATGVHAPDAFSSRESTAENSISRVSLFLVAAKKAVLIRFLARSSSQRQQTVAFPSNRPTSATVRPSSDGQSHFMDGVCVQLTDLPANIAHLQASRITVFLPRDAMRKRGLCCRPVSVRHTPVLHGNG